MISSCKKMDPRWKFASSYFLLRVVHCIIISGTHRDKKRRDKTRIKGWDFEIETGRGVDTTF